MIRTIIFDLGGVIVPLAFHRGYAQLEQRCGIPAAEIPKRIASTNLVPHFESGRLEPKAFVEQLCQHIGADLTFEEFCSIWTSVFLPHTLVSEDLIAGLKKNYRLVLLSNTNAIHWDMIRENYSLLRHFDEYVLSYKVGAMKPKERIYQEAIAKAQCAPQQCFFTDDVPAYVEGAKAAGIQAAQFINQEQLVADLRAHNVTW
jgi:putative hydrolase of the HAD superfamily